MYILRFLMIKNQIDGTCEDAHLIVNELRRNERPLPA